MALDRLIIKVPLAEDQKKVLNYLINAEGLCTCGRPLKSTDAKFILCVANSSYARDDNAKDTLVMGAYCYGCSAAINQGLKALKGSAILMKSIDPNLVKVTH